MVGQNRGSVVLLWVPSLKEAVPSTPGLPPPPLTPPTACLPWEISHRSLSVTRYNLFLTARGITQINHVPNRLSRGSCPISNLDSVFATRGAASVTSGSGAPVTQGQGSLRSRFKVKGQTGPCKKCSEKKERSLFLFKRTSYDAK